MKDTQNMNLDQQVISGDEISATDDDVADPEEVVRTLAAANLVLTSGNLKVKTP